MQTASRPGWLALYLLCTIWAHAATWSSGEEQVRFIASNKSLGQNQYAALAKAQTLRNSLLFAVNAKFVWYPEMPGYPVLKHMIPKQSKSSI